MKKRFKKIHKNKIKWTNLNYLNNFYKFRFDYYIFSKKITFVSTREIEASRKIIKRTLSKKDNLLIRNTQLVTINKKSTNSRMGKGVGNVVSYCFFLKKGHLLLNLNKEVVFKDSSKDFKRSLKKISSKFKIKKNIKEELNFSRKNIF